MTAEEFDDLANGLFENDSKYPDRFNPIIDAAKELHSDKVLINETDSGLLIYSLLFMKAKSEFLHIKVIEKQARNIVTKSNREIQSEAVKRVAERIAQNPTPNVNFDRLVREEHAIIKKNNTVKNHIIVKEYGLSFNLGNDVIGNLFFLSNLQGVLYKKASIAITGLCSYMENYYNGMIKDVLDQYLL